MIPFDIFTRNQNIKNHNKIIETESRRFWQDLVVHKFTPDEADNRTVQYRARFLEPEITFTILGEVEYINELIDFGNYEFDYTLVPLASSKKFFVFDTAEGRWLPQAYELY